jgi:tetratricopeptide (TPR) repeat protein
MRVRPPMAALLPLLLWGVGATAAAGCRWRETIIAPPAPPTDTVPSDTAVHNMVARIELLEVQLRGAPPSQESQNRRELLVGLLMTRAQVLGHLADYDEAMELAEAGARERPQDPAALVTRARIRERLHLFADALADLDAAASRGAPESSTELVRAAIFGAIGRDAEAARLLARHDAAYPDLYSLGAEAIAAARAGDMVRAEALFARARGVYRDVSPFPPAWLDFQQGRVWHERGDLARARPFYEAARARVPVYAPAVAHLAELDAKAGPDGRARAIALLRPLVAASDDPEYVADLSQLLDAGGQDRVESAHLRAMAEQGYERLLARHRAAFLDHAARFWLGPGADPARAAALAEENALLRPTAEARALLAAARSASAALAQRALTTQRAERYSSRTIIPVGARLVAETVAR